jgi:hypothetical protein
MIKFTHRKKFITAEKSYFVKGEEEFCKAKEDTA